MNRCLSLVCAGALGALSIAAGKEREPDFERDARPILQMQPGLNEYVDHRFEIQEMGEAKFPGSGQRHPVPPFIFNARPRGSEGGFFLRLLIQPGPPNHILKVVDMRRVHLPDQGRPYPAAPGQPSSPPRQLEPANNPPPLAHPPTPTEKRQIPAPASPASTSAPTADTPSGPITDSGGTSPGLEPPPDPAPAH